MSSKMVVDKAFCVDKKVSKLWTKKDIHGTFAAEDLLKGMKSKTFPMKDAVFLSNAEMNKIYIGMIEEYLEVVNITNLKNWYRYINLAADVHSANIHIDIVSHNKSQANKECEIIMLHLEVIKNIEKGNELLIWFSEELAAIIDMPFLTPKNIIGHKKYRCHICNENFEHPNPLKIHLFSSCIKILQLALWQNIEKAINKKPIKIEASQPNVYDYSTTSKLNFLPQSASSKCFSESSVSAFIPYKKSVKPQSNDFAKMDYTIIPPLSHPIHPLNLSAIPTREKPLGGWANNILELKLSQSLEEISGNYAADVELFASNWGKLKQGHLCVYCGKIYSRKYGLKIHIRTHTGYKPLKCKYCLRPFGDPSNLNKHVRLHASSLTQYICSYCGKVLVRRRDLERHIKSQHNINAGEDSKEISSD